MKPVEEPFGMPLARIGMLHQQWRGWSVFVEALGVPARVGIHPHEYGAHRQSRLTRGWAIAVHRAKQPDGSTTTGTVRASQTFSRTSRTRACLKRSCPTLRNSRFANGLRLRH
ncbi:hypothetical protein BN2476_290024 [Paraburkholderia piptadeniae]|uniref:Uncharacterized protein n=1 Tax=Paraburkholderia piptadeniae TaxID=1701573 RepID=A0A1N7S1Z5_9BURK|nr:hypothetical protein BN2476_290024 [Paraburkholderia piptadeniae]